MIIYKRAKNKWKFHSKIDYVDGMVYVGDKVKIGAHKFLEDKLILEINDHEVTLWNLIKLQIGNGSIINGAALILGNVIIGSGVFIDSSAYLKNTIIKNKVQIGRHLNCINSMIERSVRIGDNCTISEGSILQHNSIITDNSSLGYESIVPRYTRTTVIKHAEGYTTVYYDDNICKNTYIVNANKNLYRMNDNWRDYIK